MLPAVIFMDGVFVAMPTDLMLTTVSETVLT
jgi:hypothetical protein